MAHESLKIFVSYSHHDFEWQRKIAAELKLLGIDVWEDRQIKPGDMWQAEIEQALAAADIILLLISREFLSSTFVTTEELPAALRRLQVEEHPPRIIPVLLRETTWNVIFGLENIHAIPRFERWIANIGSGDKYWPNEDAAIAAVAKELREVAVEVEAERAQRSAIDEDYRIRVAEALADDDVISPYERRSLEEERSRLGLSEKDAKHVEEAEMRRHNAEVEKIRAYEADLEFAIRDVGLDFDESTEEELKKRKAKLGLKDEDVAGLKEKVAARLETEALVPTASEPGLEPEPNVAAESGPGLAAPTSSDPVTAPLLAPETTPSRTPLVGAAATATPDQAVDGATAATSGANERGDMPSERARPRLDWSIGQRVFAPWDDAFYYPGTITASQGEEYEVRFDDGALSTIVGHDLRSAELEVGSRVDARWEGGNRYYSARLDQREGESIKVTFDDGAEESTTISMLRLEQL